MRRNKFIKWLKQNWLKILIGCLPIIISIFALCKSYESNKIATEANQINNKLLELSKLEVKPYLSLNPDKFVDEEHYIKAQATGNQIEYEIRYEVKNVGKLPAKNIKTSFKKIIFEGIDTTQSLEFSDTPSSTTTQILMPDDNFFVIMRQRIGNFTQEEIAEELKKVKDDKVSIITELVVSYQAPLNLSEKYETTIKNTFTYSIAIRQSSDSN